MARNDGDSTLPKNRAEEGDRGAAVDAETIVVDPGAWAFKYGLVGDGGPRVYMPSSVGIHKGSVDKKKKGFVVGRPALGMYDPDMVLHDVIKDGRVVDWDGFEALLEFSKEVVFKDGREEGPHRYIMVESLSAESAEREKAAELLFEKFNALDTFASKTGPLNMYACARNTGLVLDVGADESRGCVIVDGFLHKGSIRTSPIAGKKVSEMLLKRLENAKIPVRPKFTFRKKTDREGNMVVTEVNAPSDPSYLKFWKLDLMDQIVHECGIIPGMKGDRLARVAKPVVTNIEEEARLPGPQADAKKKYALPDGTVIEDVDKHLDEVLGILFNTKALGGKPESRFPIQEVVVKSAQNQNNTDSRRDLFANLVLCGGLTSLRGFANRAAGEVALRSRHAKVRLIVSGKEARKSNAWIGGSIVGMLPNLKDLWVTKAEYHEQGAKIVNQKVP